MNPIKVKLTLGKETKGTYRFENEEADYPIPTLYIRKSAFSGKPPQVIRLVVEAAEG